MKTLEELTKILETRAFYYQRSIAKWETTFLKLHLLNANLRMSENVQQTVDKLHSVLQDFNVEELTANSLVLSHADEMKKTSERNEYIAKLRISIKIYSKLNKTLEKELKNCKSELKHANNQIASLEIISSDHLAALEKKAKFYETELLKLEKHHPWLNNSNLNIPTIAKEIELLTKLRVEKAELEQELSVYRDLKPDLEQARVQLAQVKLEYQEILGKLQ